MTAYMIAFVTAHSLEWVPDYLEKVPQIVRRHGGEYLALSKGVPSAVECLEGSAAIPQSIVIFRFPSMDAIHSLLDAPEYAPYRKARIAATESSLFAFENDPDAPQFVGQQPV